jgi:hypothetical protein
MWDELFRLGEAHEIPSGAIILSVLFGTRRRLDMWLIDYFHAQDSGYIRAIGPRYLISAVARIYRPGCKVDHLIIFEEQQGRQKSEALRTLAIRDEWFTDRLSHLGSKDAGLENAGVLIAEIAEMDAILRVSSSTAKTFISQRHDRFRPPYGKHMVSLPRQLVFAATINPPAGGYLKDPTGARRSGRLRAKAWLIAMAWKRRAANYGRRPSTVSKPARVGGLKHRNWRPLQLLSRRRVSSPMRGNKPFVNGYGTGSMLPSQRSWKVHSVLPARIALQRHTTG